MSEQEYKQFWISRRAGEILFMPVNCGSQTYVFNYEPRLTDIDAKPGDICHVIEHAALQAAQNKIQALQEEVDDCNKSECVVIGERDCVRKLNHKIQQLEKQNEIRNIGLLKVMVCSGTSQLQYQIALQAIKDAEEV